MSSSSSSSEKQPLMKGMKKGIPRATWANCIPSRRDATRLLPQTIAHRGYKAVYPENSMAAFRGAVEVGAHALETDIHLSADGVAVLSHDPSLKRCFGVDKKIGECSWEYLSTLETVREPRQGLPRLSDLLEWLVEPGLEKIWVLLDIKMDDDEDYLVSVIAKTLESVSGLVPWEERVVLGCWNATFLQTARCIMPTYPLAHISASILYSHHFLPVPNLGFNMNQKALIGPPGRYFLSKIRAADKQLFVWTVNEERWMEWCIRKNLGRRRSKIPKVDGEIVSKMRGDALIDGVITDDPKLFLEVCERYEDELDGKLVRQRKGMMGRLEDGVKAVYLVVTIQLLVMGYHIVRRCQGKFDYLKDRRSLDKR
ncbi:Fc.00g101160.m01.CDS01 [Cosmosporella sp. VM-42]